VAAAAPWAARAFRSARPVLAFLGLWLLLDVFVNVRYPGSELAFWYWIPSLDVVALFAAYACYGLFGKQVPRAVHIAGVALLLFARLLRLADGMVQNYYHRNFDAYVDLVLFPELVRLLRTTLPKWEFRLLLPGFVVLSSVLAVATYRVLCRVAGYLASRASRGAFAAILCVFLASSFLNHKFAYPEHYTGAFAASIVPTLKAEIEDVLRAPQHLAERRQAVESVSEKLSRIPSNLSRLQQSNVILIFIESYGETVLERSFYRDRLAPAYAAFQAELAARGFSVGSGLLDSPTYGGISWLAHATLATGIRVTNQLDYDLLMSSEARPLAHFFRAAGYRTVLVEPAVNRPWPQGDFYQFEQKYFAFNLEYQGPAFGWTTMPDQYLLDFVRRRELEQSGRPLFIECSLISSHVPWSHLPKVVEDWSRIGNGSVFRELEMIRFPITVADLSHAALAYVTSLVYDFEILKRFLVEFVRDDSLVILLGDHQPPTQLTAGSEAHGVPVHVISRNAAFVDAFIARGYTRGMWPRISAKRSSMEHFLAEFLADFSSVEQTDSSTRVPAQP
jgi:hypothetical protein